MSSEGYQSPPSPPEGWQIPNHQQRAQYTQSAHVGHALPPNSPPSHGRHVIADTNSSKQDLSQHSYSTHSQAPPASHPTDEPPPYHDWTVIPDTALLPPPPSLGHDISPTANSTLEEGDRAYQWCKANPLRQPYALTCAQHAAVQTGHIQLVRPLECTGDLLPNRDHPGRWKVRTWAECRDSCLLTSLPLYSALLDSPLQTGKSKTIYFELRVIGTGRHGIHGLMSEADAGIAIGFVAPPYPTWRLPGWQRGSLGVHGDDGRRYVNDTFGGIDFTTKFNPGQTVGIGMSFSTPENPPDYSQQDQPRMLDIAVFFTRDEKKDGGWDLHEEQDARSEGGVMGLEGECDLFAAIGVFGGVDFEVRFKPEDWLYVPLGGLSSSTQSLPQETQVGKRRFRNLFRNG